MQVIGLLGGMSWESTQEYYRLLNQGVQQRLGGAHSARILLYSVDFEPVVAAQHVDDWERATQLLVEGARRVERGGADFGLLCTNTMHKCFDALQAAVALPFLHVVDVTADAVRSAGHGRVGLLGTRFTMEQAFYRDRLRSQGVESLVPEAADREIIHRVIYEELCRGVISDASRREYVRIIEALADQGADGVVLGCTEIGLLIHTAEAPLPVYDTTHLHAQAALDRALAA